MKCRPPALEWRWLKPPFLAKLAIVTVALLFIAYHSSLTETLRCWLGGSECEAEETSKDGGTMIYSLLDSCKCLRAGRDVTGLTAAPWPPKPGRPADGAFVGESSCSAFATSLGAGQNVVAYSLYEPLREPDERKDYLLHTNEGKLNISYRVYSDGSPTEYEERYTELLPTLAGRIHEAYPGWRMRVYHNVTASGSVGRGLCRLHCRFPHVDVCNVSGAAFADGVPANGSVAVGRFWRFLVLGDPTVSRFLSRYSTASFSAVVSALQYFSILCSGKFSNLRRCITL